MVDRANDGYRPHFGDNLSTAVADQELSIERSPSQCKHAIKNTVWLWVTLGAPLYPLWSLLVIRSRPPAKIGITRTLIDIWHQVWQVLPVCKPQQSSLDLYSPPQESLFVESVDSRHQASQHLLSNNLKYYIYRLSGRSTHYDDGVASYMARMAQRMEVQLRPKMLDSSNSISVLLAPPAVGVGCYTNMIHEGAATWLFKCFIKNCPSRPQRPYLSLQAELHTWKSEIDVISRSHQL